MTAAGSFVFFPEGQIVGAPAFFPGYCVKQNRVGFVTATENLISCISLHTVCQLLHGGSTIISAWH